MTLDESCFKRPLLMKLSRVSQNSPTLYSLPFSRTRVKFDLPQNNLSNCRVSQGLQRSVCCYNLEKKLQSCCKSSILSHSWNSSFLCYLLNCGEYIYLASWLWMKLLLHSWVWTWIVHLGVSYYLKLLSRGAKDSFGRYLYDICNMTLFQALKVAWCQVMSHQNWV